MRVHYVCVIAFSSTLALFLLVTCGKRSDGLVVFYESPEKQTCELGYWKKQKAKEIHLSNKHYERVFTEGFAWSPSFYNGKRVLDVGCGPRGSLEWMENASARLCADPLALEYGLLGATAHKMTYVKAGAEDLPFPSATFDIVTSLNNLDHVTNVDAALSAIARVLRPSGYFLLAVEIHKRPTACEPQALSWEFPKAVRARGFLIEEERHHEVGSPYFGLYSVFNRRFDHTNRTERDGYMVVRARRAQ